MLGGELGPKPHGDRPAVFSRTSANDPLPFGRGPRMIRRATRAPVLQSPLAFRPIPPRQTFRLTIAHGQQGRRRSHTQRPRLHTAQHLHPCHFPRAHPVLPSRNPLRGHQLRGHFYFAREGTLSFRVNSRFAAGTDTRQRRGVLPHPEDAVVASTPMYSRDEVKALTDKVLNMASRPGRGSRFQGRRAIGDALRELEHHRQHGPVRPPGERHRQAGNEDAAAPAPGSSTMPRCRRW